MKKYSLKINGNQYEVKVDEVNEASTEARVVVNGIKYNVEIEGGKARQTSKPAVVAAPAATGLSVKPVTPIASKPAATVSSGHKVTCPLPGTILAIKVKEGDTVSAGQTLVVLEAMKMENNINADREGTVVSINVEKGQSIAEGTDIITLG